MSFSNATRLDRIDDTTWQGEVQPGWDIVGNANGGYLLAIAARAAMLASGRPDPVTVTGHFLAPATPGPVLVTAEVLKEGRRFATVRATVSTLDGKPIVAALGSYGALDSREGPERVDAVPPDLPPVGDCVQVMATDTFPPPFMNNVDLRLHPDDVPFGAGESPGTPRVRGWFRWPGAEPLDTLGLVVASDAFPPTIFNANLPVAWTPTIELTTHVRERPTGEWLQCAFTTRFITGGFLEEDGELWDMDGRLIAQSRQLALLPQS